MKRISANLFLILLAAIVPLSTAFGQEKKSEQKIKIVIDDGSGAKTVLDTTFNDGKLPETINLKDGKIIILGKPGKVMTHVESGSGKEKFYVTVTDADSEDNEERDIIIMSSDSVKHTISPSEKKKHVYVYANSTETDGEPVIVTSTATSKSGSWSDDKGERVIIIKDGKTIDSGKDGKTFNIRVESDNNEKDSDVTKYIVAKDGIVVTVESDNEAKAKEIIQMINDKLGVKSDNGEKKETVKVDARKAEKNK